MEILVAGTGAPAVSAAAGTPFIPAWVVVVHGSGFWEEEVITNG
jgi:hypothetical protein